MCAALLLLVAATSPTAATIVYKRGELRLQDPTEVGDHVTSPLPHTYLTAEDIPKSYDPNDLNGLTLVTSDLNQHIPQYCGSCWAHAPVGSFRSRAVSAGVSDTLCGFRSRAVSAGVCDPLCCASAREEPGD